MAGAPPSQLIPGLGHANAQPIDDFEAQFEAGIPITTPAASRTAPPASSEPGLSALRFEEGRAWSSESVSEFNTLCSKNTIVHAFHFTQVRVQPPGWAVVLTFMHATLESEGDEFKVDLPGPFPSKKEAKAAAAEQGVVVLRDALELKKRKQPSAPTAGGAETKDGQDSSGDERENWVGLLLEYCHASNTPAPQYQEFRVGSNFSCECLGVIRPEQPFGGRGILFSNKKAAKANAARDAVKWLRANDCMPKSGHPSKKRVKAAAAAASLAGVNGAPAVGTVPPPAATTTATSPGSSSESEASSGSGALKDKSLGEQVMVLCSRLGCAQPIYRISPDPRVPSMWSGAAFFPHDPSISEPGAPIGEVHNIYGKKKAREQVAKRVLKHLKAKRADRQKEAEAVLAAAGIGNAGS